MVKEEWPPNAQARNNLEGLGGVDTVAIALSGTFHMNCVQHADLYEDLFIEHHTGGGLYMCIYRIIDAL